MKNEIDKDKRLMDDAISDAVDAFMEKYPNCDVKIWRVYFSDIQDKYRVQTKVIIS